MSMLWKIMVHKILDQVNLVCRNQLWNTYMFPGAPTKLKIWPRCGAYLMTPSPLLFKNIQYTCWHVIVGSLQLLTKKQSTEVKYFSFCLSPREKDGDWSVGTKGGGHLSSYGTSEGGAEAIGAIQNLSFQAWFVAKFLVAKYMNGKGSREAHCGYSRY